MPESQSPFRITIEVDWESLPPMTSSQKSRLSMKMQRVQDSAIRLCEGMLKGTLKYESEDLSILEWVEHLMSESVDHVNYCSFLLKLLKDGRAL